MVASAFTVHSSLSRLQLHHSCHWQCDSACALRITECARLLIHTSTGPGYGVVFVLTHLSPVVLRVIGGPHGGHAPLSTTTHLSPVVLHVMEVPMEGACHSPHAPRSAVGHMMAIGGSHITSRTPHHASTRWLRSLHWCLEVAACLFVSC